MNNKDLAIKIKSYTRTGSYEDQLEAIEKLLNEERPEQLHKHVVNGWRPKTKDVQTAAKKHASAILGIVPDEVLPDDTIVNGFMAGVWWAIYPDACR